MKFIMVLLLFSNFAACNLFDIMIEKRFILNEDIKCNKLCIKASFERFSSNVLKEKLKMKFPDEKYPDNAITYDRFSIKSINSGFELKMYNQFGKELCNAILTFVGTEFTNYLNEQR